MLNYRALNSPGPSVYGAKGSIRVDVFERVGDGTVCVYEIKTGKEELAYTRMREIARRVLKRYPDTTQIIVTEVRPTKPQ